MIRLLYDIIYIYFRYNRIRTESIPIEFQLVKDEVMNIDNIIDDGQEKYNWNSEGRESNLNND